MTAVDTIGDLRIVTLELAPIGTNCYVVHRIGERRAVVIDPGGEPERVLEVLTGDGLSAEAVLVTHCHWDHIGGVAGVARDQGSPVYMSRVESSVLEDIASFAPAQFGPYENWKVDHELDGTESLEIAGISFELLPLPGHSPGSIGFAVRETGAAPVLFVGDLIFQGSVGRTDLPFADHAQLLGSARLVFDSLPDDTWLYSGHGPRTTIAAERAGNPFLRELSASGGGR